MIVGVYTLFKVATLQGLSNYVFIAYSYTVSTIVLLPVYFFYTRFVLLQIICLRIYVYNLAYTLD